MRIETKAQVHLNEDDIKDAIQQWLHTTQCVNISKGDLTLTSEDIMEEQQESQGYGTEMVKVGTKIQCTTSFNVGGIKTRGEQPNVL